MINLIKKAPVFAFMFVIILGLGVFGIIASLCDEGTLSIDSHVPLSVKYLTDYLPPETFDSFKREALDSLKKTFASAAKPAGADGMSSSDQQGADVSLSSGAGSVSKEDDDEVKLTVVNVPQTDSTATDANPVNGDTDSEWIDLGDGTGRVLTEEEQKRRDREYEYDYGGEYVKRNDVVTEYVKWNDDPPRSIYYDNPGIRPLTTFHHYDEVDSSYFADSLFIGDSRIQGLHDYSGWDCGTFMYKQGLNVYNMMTEVLDMGDGRSAYVSDVISQNKFNNIYIMLGINELAAGTTETFAEKYKENLDFIRKFEPNARIIIMGIMYVTKDYSDRNDIYNNDNINSRNAAIAEYADGINTFYLDMNGCVIDDSGALDPNITFDGIHLKAQYYKYWTDFMCRHAY
ncbi:MAG: hypothetical protein K5662_07750 [Lachnospiraceae bacterium]|nr:hypothetical protein [Lachnospiraceae bacterium]